MLPHLVADDDQVVLAGDRGDGFQLLGAEQTSGGVVRIVEEDGAGPGPDRSRERVALDPPAGGFKRYFARHRRRRAGSSAHSCRRRE